MPSYKTPRYFFTLHCTMLHCIHAKLKTWEHEKKWKRGNTKVLWWPQYIVEHIRSSRQPPWKNWYSSMAIIFQFLRKWIRCEYNWIQWFRIMQFPTDEFQYVHRFSDFTHTTHSWNNENWWSHVKILYWPMQYRDLVCIEFITLRCI